LKPRVLGQHGKTNQIWRHCCLKQPGEENQKGMAFRQRNSMKHLKTGSIGKLKKAGWLEHRGRGRHWQKIGWIGRYGSTHIGHLEATYRKGSGQRG
jgi:hypothetical protein